MGEGHWGMGRSMRRNIRLILVLVVGLASFALIQQAGAVPPNHYFDFDRVWSRTDYPVFKGKVSRTWMWGPSNPGETWAEAFAEAKSPDGWRTVAYFDKSRMEVTYPDADAQSPWYVTNGLLSKELITGNLQLGEDTYRSFAPAAIPVTGDPDDTSAPTYAALKPLLAYAPIPTGWTVIQTVDHAGSVGADQRFVAYSVAARDVGAPTSHTVASVFWDFMNSSGLVWIGYHEDEALNRFVTEPLFPNPFYATGYPITEAYWTKATVAGTPKDVLLQCFERRCLTYTPDNPDGWKAEAGNVGAHYFHWRYGQLGYGSARVASASLSPEGALRFNDYPSVYLGSGTDGLTLPLGGVELPKPGACDSQEAWNYIISRLPGQQLAIEGTGESYWAAHYRFWLGSGMQEFFNETLVREGYATVNTEHPDPLYQNRLIAAQQRAQQEENGIWGDCP